MMLQLFLTVLMLTLAAFELVIVYEGHFVARSVGQFESEMRTRATLDYLANHCIARLMSEAVFRSRVQNAGSVTYTVSVETFMGTVRHGLLGVITCSQHGESSYALDVSLVAQSNRSDVVARDAVELQWDETRSLYVVRYSSRS